MTDQAAAIADPEDIPFGYEPDGYVPRRPEVRSYAGIPSGLLDREPGPVLAAFLSSLDPAELSPHDQVVVLQAHQKMESYHSSQMYASMAALHTSMLTYDGYEQSFEDAAQSASGEIRTALRLTSRSADIEMTFALNLYQRLPRLAAMLESGYVDRRRARVIDRATTHLSDAQACDVVDAIADTAPGLTTGQLRERIRKLCIAIDPDDAKERYERSVEDRRVVMEPTDDGTSNLLGLDLPPDKVAAIGAYIHESAMRLHVKGETRTMDQLRADIYLDLLRGAAHGTTSPDGAAGVIEIVCDLETLAELADRPGNLAGYGPVIADIARKIADQSHDGEWRYTCVNDIGIPVHTGTTSRRPTTTQKRRIQARHRTCVFPGCRTPAGACDIDHTTAVVDGGQTCDCNLAPLCRRDHRIKHTPGWSYAINGDGTITWTTPSGHTYTVTPSRAPP
ncbi:MAG: DUF222 domain-containing protein [Actinomycetota bacterium]